MRTTFFFCHSVSNKVGISYQKAKLSVFFLTKCPTTRKCDTAFFMEKFYLFLTPIIASMIKVLRGQVCKENDAVLRGVKFRAVNFVFL